MFKGLFSRTTSDGRSRKVVKLEKKITNMYLQPGDRQYYLSQLRQIGSEEATIGLMKRFQCACENTTIDRDEKEMTHRMLIEMGDDAVEPVKAYLRTNDKGINWPLKALRTLISRERFVEFMVELFESIGPDYVRDPERKEQLILTAKDYKEESICRAMLPYLDDDNETIRYVCAEALISQGFDFVVPELGKRVREEDSQRVVKHICEAFVEHGWVLEDPEEDIAEFIPDGFKRIKNGTLKKR